MKVDYSYNKYKISLTVLKGSYNPMRMLEYDASLNNAAPVPEPSQTLVSADMQNPGKKAFVQWFLGTYT